MRLRIKFKKANSGPAKTRPAVALGGVPATSGRRWTGGVEMIGDRPASGPAWYAVRGRAINRSARARIRKAGSESIAIGGAASGSRRQHGSRLCRLSSRSAPDGAASDSVSDLRSLRNGVSARQGDDTGTSWTMTRVAYSRRFYRARRTRTSSPRSEGNLRPSRATSTLARHRHVAGPYLPVISVIYRKLIKQNRLNRIA